MDEKQVRYATDMAERRRQAHAQEDGHFDRKVSDTCHWCGCVHRNAEEYRECLLANIG